MPSLVFSTGNLLAMLGWLVLLAALALPRRRERLIPVTRFVVPGVLAVAYAALILAGHDAFRDGGFSSLTQVRALFANNFALTAGWLHYLAFDLFTGTWIVEDSGRRGVPLWLVVPCMVLTFLFGPCGYLLYLLLRVFNSPTQVA